MAYVGVSDMSYSVTDMKCLSSAHGLFKVTEPTLRALSDFPYTWNPDRTKRQPSYGQILNYLVKLSHYRPRTGPWGSRRLRLQNV